MPDYRFVLQDGDGGIADATGVNLPDRTRALAYARSVAGELMRGREQETRSWCLDVYEGENENVFEIPFASLDPTLDHLRPDLRETVEIASDHRRSLAETVHDLHETIRESRALVARSRGELYVAAEHGRSIIRDK